MIPKEKTKQMDRKLSSGGEKQKSIINHSIGSSEKKDKQKKWKIGNECEKQN